MESIYNSYIPEDLARKMLDVGFPLYKYGIGDYNGKPSFFTVDEDNPMWETCDRFRIPTYAETLDMLLDKNIIISIEPTDELKFEFFIYFQSTKGKISSLSSVRDNFKTALEDATSMAICF